MDASDDLDAVVQELRQGPRIIMERGEGVGEAAGEKEEGGEPGEQANDEPWEPKAQWEDNMHRVEEKEGEGRKPGKIWSFLEEKTRVSNEERAQAVVSKPAAQAFR